MAAVTDAPRVPADFKQRLREIAKRDCYAFDGIVDSIENRVAICQDPKYTRPLVLFMTGVSGAGKSYYSEEVLRVLGFGEEDVAKFNCCEPSDDDKEGLYSFLDGLVKAHDDHLGARVVLWLDEIDKMKTMSPKAWGMLHSLLEDGVLKRKSMTVLILATSNLGAENPDKDPCYVHDAVKDKRRLSEQEYHALQIKVYDEIASHFKQSSIQRRLTSGKEASGVHVFVPFSIDQMETALKELLDERGITPADDFFEQAQRGVLGETAFVNWTSVKIAADAIAAGRDAHIGKDVPAVVSTSDNLVVIVSKDDDDDEEVAVDLPDDATRSELNAELERKSEKRRQRSKAVVLLPVRELPAVPLGRLCSGPQRPTLRLVVYDLFCGLGAFSQALHNVAKRLSEEANVVIEFVAIIGSDNDDPEQILKGKRKGKFRKAIQTSKEAFITQHFLNGNADVEAYGGGVTLREDLEGFHKAPQGEYPVRTVYRDDGEGFYCFEQDVTKIDPVANPIPVEYHGTITTGGFPCQSFSMASRKRQGMADEVKGHLVLEFARVAVQARSTAVIGENVNTFATNMSKTGLPGETFAITFAVFQQLGIDLMNVPVQSNPISIPTIKKNGKKRGHPMSRQRVFLPGVVNGNEVPPLLGKYLPSGTDIEEWRHNIFKEPELKTRIGDCIDFDNRKWQSSESRDFKVIIFMHEIKTLLQDWGYALPPHIDLGQLCDNPPQPGMRMDGTWQKGFDKASGTKDLEYAYGYATSSTRKASFSERCPHEPCKSPVHPHCLVRRMPFKGTRHLWECIRKNPTHKKIIENMLVDYQKDTYCDNNAVSDRNSGTLKMVVTSKNSSRMKIPPVGSKWLPNGGSGLKEGAVEPITLTGTRLSQASKCPCLTANRGKSGRNMFLPMDFFGETVEGNPLKRKEMVTPPEYPLRQMTNSEVQRMMGHENMVITAPIVSNLHHPNDAAKANAFMSMRSMKAEGNSISLHAAEMIVDPILRHLLREFANSGFKSLPTPPEPPEAIAVFLVDRDNVISAVFVKLKVGETGETRIRPFPLNDMPREESLRSIPLGTPSTKSVQKGLTANGYEKVLIFNDVGASEAFCLKYLNGKAKMDVDAGDVNDDVNDDVDNDVNDVVDDDVDDVVDEDAPAPVPIKPILRKRPKSRQRPRPSSTPAAVGGCLADLVMQFGDGSDFRYADLFCGGGAMSFAVKHLFPKAKCVYANDCDKTKCKIYKAWHDVTPVQGDIVDHIENSGILNSDSSNFIGSNVDLLCGGFPCPVFSYKGNRLGIDDKRKKSGGHLFEEGVLPFMKIAKPKWGLFENVAGLLTAKVSGGGLVIDLFKQMLNDAGYEVQIVILNPRHLLIPHNRERIFILCRRYDIATPISTIIAPNVASMDTSFDSVRIEDVNIDEDELKRT